MFLFKKSPFTNSELYEIKTKIRRYIDQNFDYLSTIRFALSEKPSDDSNPSKSDKPKIPSFLKIPNVDLTNYNRIASVSEYLSEKQEKSFTDLFIEFIQRDGRKDSEIYKSAQIDRRVYSKIISGRDKSPSTDTIVSFCLALKLSLEESSQLLKSSSSTLSHSSNRDLILEYCIIHQYSVLETNEILDSFQLRILGGKGDSDHLYLF